MRRFVGGVLAVAGLWACDARSGATDTAARDAADADDASQEGSTLDDASAAGDGDGDKDSGGDDGGKAAAPVYALKTVVDVTWGYDAQLPVYDPGSGAITLFHRLSTDSACEDGEIEALDLVPCGIEFPEYTSILACAAYQLEIAEGGALALDGETSVSLELSKLGVTYREAACGLGVGPASALVFRGLLATQTSTTDCDPTIDDASLGGCAQARSLTALIDAQLTLGSELGLCEGTDAAVSATLEVTAFAVTMEACALRDGSACTEYERDYAASFLPEYAVTGTRTTIVRLDAEASRGDCAGVRSAVETRSSVR
jgi:hypothetical protein